MRATNLSTSDGKVGKNAVFFVLVSGVGLEALPLAVVPEFEGVVEGGRQNVLAIRGKFDEGHGGIVIVYQCF